MAMNNVRLNVQVLERFQNAALKKNIPSIVIRVMPFVKTGGLADVLGSLPSAIQRLGHDVTVFLPRYKAVDFREWKLEVVVNRLEVKIGSEQETGRVYQLTAKEGPKIYFIDQPVFSGTDNEP